MDLDELQSVQSRERQKDSLQQLRESFYSEAGEFIAQLRRERDRAAEEADDPWSSPAVNRLNDDIDTAKDTVEAIYERRVGKIVKMASLAAADMTTNDEGLTAEERDLFETLVDTIEQNRHRVEAVLDGDDPASVVADEAASVESATSATPTADETPADPTVDETPVEQTAEETPADPTADETSVDPGADETPTPDAGGVDAADLMGSGSDSEPSTRPDDDAGPPSDSVAEPDRDTTREADAGPTREADAGPAPDSGSVPGAEPAEPAPPDSTSEPTESAPEPTTNATREPPAEAPPEPPADLQTESAPPEDSSPASSDESDGDGDTQRVGTQPETTQIERETVRITNDVGEIFGIDERRYDLTADDIVTLPADNAKPLVERDAAERLD